MTKTRNKYRLHFVLTEWKFIGSMRGTGRELGDIVSPSWDDGPCDAELGIAYRGENGVPVYYTGNGAETTDDL